MSECLVPFLILSLIQAFLAHRGRKREGRDEEVEIEKSEASWKEQAADERERGWEKARGVGRAEPEPGVIMARQVCEITALVSGGT